MRSRPHNAERAPITRASDRNGIVQILLIAIIIQFTATGLAMSAFQNAQDDDVTRARALARKVQEQVRRGDPQGALKMLETMPEMDPRATAILQYTLGWVHHQAALKSPDDAETHLFLAVMQYELVLGTLKGQVQVKKNLYGALLELGDLFAQVEESIPGAFDQYERAMRLLPLDVRAPSRFVSLYALAPEARFDDAGNILDADNWPKRLLRTCEQIALNGHLPIASRGYAGVIHRYKDADQSEVMDLALEGWVEIEGEQGTFDATALNRLPSADQWDHSGMYELRELLKAGDTSLEFWRDSIRRRHAITAALRSFGRAAARSGEVASAEVIYQHAREIAPSIDHYREGKELAGRPLLTLELASDLAALYNAYPELEVGGGFDELENELLSEKNDSYLRGDLPAMQSFHTVLGLIYAARDDGRWQMDNWKHAPYHLERAVKIAQRRAGRKSDEYQPLPQLTHILADGLAGERPSFALEKYIEAAMGYLDQNAYTEAQTVIDAARKVKVNGGPSPQMLNKLDELQNIAEFRRDALRHDPGPGPDADLDPNTSHFIPSFGTEFLDSTFVDRQSTRLFTDLRDRAHALGNDGIALEWQRRAAMLLMDAPNATGEEIVRVLDSPVTMSRPDEFQKLLSNRSAEQTMYEQSSYVKAVARLLDPDRVVGGGGGRPFTDRVEEGWRISRITVRADRFIHSIQFEVISGSNRKSHGPHGGEKGEAHQITLAEDEYVLGISGRYDQFVRSLAILTNKRRYGPFGAKGGAHTFDLRAPEGYVVVGFKGRCGAGLDAIGIVVERRSPGAK